MNQKDYNDALVKTLEPIGFKVQFDEEYDNVQITHRKCPEFYVHLYWYNPDSSWQYSHRTLNETLELIMEELYRAGVEYERDNHRCW